MQALFFTFATVALMPTDAFLGGFRPRPAAAKTALQGQYWPPRKPDYYEEYLKRVPGMTNKTLHGEAPLILGLRAGRIIIRQEIEPDDDDADDEADDDPDNMDPSETNTLEGVIKNLDKLRNKAQRQQQKNAPKSSENFEVIRNMTANFAQVGGYENIKQELMQCADILVNYTKYAPYNVRVPKGLILEGPPGNGKTLLARSFAGETGTAFIAVSGAQFQEKWVGVGASRIRELFELAHKNAPCIIFVDEIDALGRKRSQDGEGATTERDSTLNELLVALDGFKTSDGVFLVGATNRADMLDPALLRPGRIDKRIYIGEPDAKTRDAILRIHMRGKPYATDKISLSDLVDSTAGFSGAQIENWLNEAMLYALRQDRRMIEPADLEAVQGRILAGWQPTEHEVSREMLERIAVHEMGHAVVGMLCKNHAPVVKVIINLSSPSSPGYTLFENENAAIMHTSEALFERLMVLLAGRIAEEVFYDMSMTTGAINDLEKAHALAEKMVGTYGMGRNRIIYPRTSDAFREMMDTEVADLIRGAYVMAEKLVRENQKIIRECTQMLIETRVVRADEIARLIAHSGEIAN